MRPPSIVRFDRLFLLSIGLWLVGTLLGWSTMTVQVAASPDIARLGVDASILVGIVTVPMLLLALGLWYGTARRGSRLARIGVILLAIANTALLVSNLGSGASVSEPAALFQMAAVVIELLAVRALFRADARAWFRPDMPKDHL